MICNSQLFLILLVVWHIVTEIVSESYTNSYDGYVFTSPFFNPYKTKDDAKMWCVQNGSKLLEIKSSYVQNLTLRFLNDWPTGVQYPDGTLLIITDGIRNDVGWNWVNYQGIHSISVSGQGNDLANSFGYINFNPSLPLISASIPTVMRGYICQVAGKVDCKNGLSKNGSCFQSYSSPTLSWFDARNRCLNDGGDLASFDLINNNLELNSTLYGSWLSSPTTYWIGIRRQWWKWETSNLEANYTNWMNDRPVYVLGSQCLCLLKSGSDWKWIECDCGSNWPFVCLSEPPATPSISTSTVQPSSGYRNITDAYSNTSTMGSSWSTAAAAVTMGSADGHNGDSALGIGLGVGIGGALIIAAIILAAIFVIRKRGCPRWFEKTPKSNPPDVTLHPIIPDHYAEIPNQTGSGNYPTLDNNQSQSTLPVVYADLEIVTRSPPSHENDPVSLLSSRTATLLSPPIISHKTTTHFTVDGQEYAEVKAI